jgi:hypothetical protein
VGPTIDTILSDALLNFAQAPYRSSPAALWQPFRFREKNLPIFNFQKNIGRFLFAKINESLRVL